MNSLQRVAMRISQLHRLSTVRELSSNRNGKIGGGEGDDGDGWNDAWETAWLPEDSDKAVVNSRAPWEADVNFGLGGDAEAKEFLADMDENWSERRGRRNSEEKVTFAQKEKSAKKDKDTESESLYSLDNMKRDYRLKKQRIHAGLWMKEIEKLEESKFGSECDDIERLIDSCSDIFDTGNGGFEDEKLRNAESEFKAKPDGWETTLKTENDSNVWEMTQREEDVLLQEFDRRIAFSKFQIASFIKSHIFSRRRPIDGWKYMIEELGPNARKGKGGVSRLPALSDSSTQPYKEEKTPFASNSLEPFRKR